MATRNPANEPKGEKKLKGCIKSEGGKYVLEEKHGKEITLSGSQDFAFSRRTYSHGPTACGAVDWIRPAAALLHPTAETSAWGGQFMVSKLDMVSESCKMEKVGNSQDSNSKPSPNHK
jgi:hypothetical protein